MMTPRIGKERVAPAVALLLTVLILGGCTSIKYSYDTGTGFSMVKTYAWAPAAGIYGGQDSVLEANVRDLADQALGQKGFTKVAEKSNVFVFMTYEPELRFKMLEPEISYPQDSHQLRMLTLNMYTSDKKELVWRGAASGSIATDASSSDLRHAMLGILSDVPSE